MRHSALPELHPFWPFRTFSPPLKPWNSRCLLLILLSSKYLGRYPDGLTLPDHIWVVDLYLYFTPSWVIPQGFFLCLPTSSLCSSWSLCCVTHSAISLVLTILTKVYFSIIFSSSDTQPISAWVGDISSWMFAHRFKLITGDNNIVNPAQTTKHLGVIPSSKLSNEALIAATKLFLQICALKHWLNQNIHSPGT